MEYYYLKSQGYEEVYGKRILFDTGADGSIFLHNMEKLNIGPMAISEVFISHAHWDYTGGLSDFFKINPVKVYVPSSCRMVHSQGGVIEVKGSLKIYENIFRPANSKV